MALKLSVTAFSQVVSTLTSPSIVSFKTLSSDWTVEAGDGWRWLDMAGHGWTVKDPKDSRMFEHKLPGRIST
jgi:hypothetical protein